MECEALASDAVTLERATPDMSPLVENLLELYIHDLSEIFAVELGPDGRFGYEKLPLYWTDSVGRHIFLIKYGSRVAGFAMATRGSPVSQSPTDLDVAEFFVLRAFRRLGVGRQAAFTLWDTIRGQWVVRRGNKRDRRQLLERGRPFLHVWRVRREHYGRKLRMVGGSSRSRVGRRARCADLYASHTADVRQRLWCSGHTVKGKSAYDDLFYALEGCRPGRSSSQGSDCRAPTLSRRVR